MKNKVTGFKEIRVKKHRGAALLISMVVLASVLAFYFMSQFGGASQSQRRIDSRVASLAEAKKALIAYAVNYSDSYDTNGVKHDGQMGFLPCPTTGINPAEGVQDPNCNGSDENAIGRFPWRSLDLAPQYDESGECLWYAVSGYYKANPKTDMLNDDSNGMLKVHNPDGSLLFGATPENRIVALIIAPGKALQGQSRTTVAGTDRCGGNYIETNYLEGDGVIDNSALNAIANQADAFIKAGTNTNIAQTPFNDLIITITRDEIWNAISRRKDFAGSMQTLTEEIATCVRNYGNAGTDRNLPWPAEIDLSGADYRDNLNYSDIDINAFAPVSHLGRLARTVDDSENELLNNAGNGNNGNGNGNNGNNGGGNNGNGNGNNGNNGGGNNGNGNGNNGNNGGGNNGNGNGNNGNNGGGNNGNGNGNNGNNGNGNNNAGGSTPKGNTDLFSYGGCISAANQALWQHWKDHFFYVVSNSFAPDSTNVTCTGGGTNCVTVGGIERAGIVIFSAERLAGQTRNDPVAKDDDGSNDTDTRNDIANYLEGSNATNFEDTAGDGVYSTGAGNDYMFCINEAAAVGGNLTVGVCQ